MDTDVWVPIVLAVIIAAGTVLIFMYVASRFPLDE